MDNTSNKTLTIRLTAEQADILERVKVLTGQQTGSKAMLKAIETYASNHDLRNNNLRRTSQLEAEIQRLQQVINEARSSCSSFLNQISQPDLFGN